MSVAILTLAVVQPRTAVVETLAPAPIPVRPAMSSPVLTS
jgi:hypothetical protein